MLVPRERVQQRTAEKTGVGGSGPSWPRAKGRSSAVDTAVARPADKARPPGIAKKSATTESDIAVFSDEARPPGIEKQSVTTDSDIAVSIGQAEKFMRGLRLR